MGRLRANSDYYVAAQTADPLTNPTWSYNIPVQRDGTFSAEVKSPVAGQVKVYLYTNYINDLTLIGNGQYINETPVHFTVQFYQGGDSTFRI